MTGIKDLNREKARFAYDKISEVRQVSNFKSNLKNIPMYIYTNGLIATMLFIIKKGKENSYKKIDEIILCYIKDKNLNNFGFTGKNTIEFVDFLIGSDSKQYRRITLDMISILDWLVRFADGIIEEDKKVSSSSEE